MAESQTPGEAQEPKAGEHAPEQVTSPIGEREEGLVQNMLSTEHALWQAQGEPDSIDHRIPGIRMYLQRKLLIFIDIYRYQFCSCAVQVSSIESLSY